MSLGGECHLIKFFLNFDCLSICLSHYTSRSVAHNVICVLVLVFVTIYYIHTFSHLNTRKNIQKLLCTPNTLSFNLCTTVFFISNSDIPSTGSNFVPLTYSRNNKSWTRAKRSSCSTTSAPMPSTSPSPSCRRPGPSRRPFWRWMPPWWPGRASTSSSTCCLRTRSGARSRRRSYRIRSCLWEAPSSSSWLWPPFQSWELASSSGPSAWTLTTVR